MRCGTGSIRAAAGAWFSRGVVQPRRGSGPGPATLGAPDRQANMVWQPSTVVAGVSALAIRAVLVGVLVGVVLVAPVGGPRPAVAASKRLEGVVNLNTATADLLMLLPGLGPAKVETILLYRQRHPFRTVDELSRVKGIGRRMVKELRPHLAVVGPSTASVTAVKTDLATLRRLETAAPTGTDGRDVSQGRAEPSGKPAASEAAPRAASGGQVVRPGGAGPGPPRPLPRASEPARGSPAASGRERWWRLSVVPCLGNP